MSVTVNFQKLNDKLTACNQQHLLRFWDQLSDASRNNLAAQIANVDFAHMRSLIGGSHQATDWGALAARAKSPPAIRLNADQNLYSREDALQIGEAALREGKVGVVVVAGGQGSRLGFPHPKGMYPLGPVSKRTLFQILADRLIGSARRYGVSLPFFVMTSPATHGETVAYFKEHDYCGLNPADVIIFCQGTMPAVDADSGRLLLADKGSLFLSPDGHGGTMAAMSKAGCFEELKRRGVEYLFYFQVDNPMVVIADPELIGYHIMADSEMTTQVVAKHDPLERVGNVVSIDGQLQIIEYSDLPEDAAQRRNPDGSLAIWAGSIAVHVFDVEFLNRMVAQADALPFHQATKKVPYINDDGDVVSPDEPNAVKFERFIFDLLPNAQHGLVVEVDEAEGFAPLKNAPGAAKDTEQTAQAAMINQHRRWLEEAGATVVDGVAVEISQAFALDVDELKTKIEPGLQIDSNKYFG
jgi:UDP-N-acetylglucosamine/UDP-N-acetylgalactosamine diphosphorylase